ncbi:hypothetical protein DV737_g2781, partial [Chaetothyriales sp. CBS 132003]
MPKAKDKKSKAEQKAAKAQKQSKKAAKGEKKLKGKAQDVDSDDDTNVDLDAVLAAYAEEQAKFLKVTEKPCGAPSPRSSCTVLASPSNRSELFIFGGEFMDSNGICHFYNDLFVYNSAKGEFSQVTSPNSPPPRSGHAWCRSGNTGKIYMGFGEFSSPKQGIFYHFNSFYMLDPDTREWAQMEPKGKGRSPPARSGHRMTYWKNFILLFGGFQDTSQQTKYLNDTWVYDCRENVWHEMKAPAATQKPDPRSSFSFLPHESGAVLYGGYSRVKTTTTASKPAGAPPGMRWERRKRPANGPSPTRTGSSMAYHKGRGIFFGGVHDVEESEEGIDSEFFNDMYIWNIDRNRFFPLTLRRPKAAGAKKLQVQSRARDRGKADEEELLRNLAALETKGSIGGADEVDIPTTQDDTMAEQESKREYPVKFEMPHPRFNAQLTVQEDTLYIFGGTFEKKDVEITFADLYAVDLGKLDGVKELEYAEPVNWNVTQEESEDESDEDMSEGDDDDHVDRSDADTNADSPRVATPSTPTTTAASLRPSASTAHTADEMETEETQAASSSSLPFPRAFESLREFFARTSNEWQSLLLKQTPDATSEGTLKELRKKAFSQAENRWWDAREEVMALEDEQEAAGIGEVVNLGIVLSRAPLLTPDAHPFETAYHLYQRRLNERLVLPFTQYLYYKRGTPKDSWHDEALVGDECGSDQHILEQLVDEEGRSAEFTPRGRDAKTSGLARATAADERNDTRSLERKLSRTLYLLVKAEQSGKGEKGEKGGWAFPSGPLLPRQQGKEGLREAAKRVLTETCGRNMNTWFVGAHPVGHWIRRPWSGSGSGSDSEKQAKTEKTFFMKARIFAGQANVQQDAQAYQDFKWLTKEEIKTVVDSSYWSRIQDMLVAQ